MAHKRRKIIHCTSHEARCATAQALRHVIPSGDDLDSSLPMGYIRSVRSPGVSSERMSESAWHFLVGVVRDNVLSIATEKVGRCRRTCWKAGGTSSWPGNNNMM